MQIETPGGWYADGWPDQRYVHLVTNSHLATSFGRVELPNRQNLLYVDMAPSGNRFAGVGNSDDQCWEWDGAWTPHGPAAGQRPVIYDASGQLLIVRVSGPPPTGADGWRYLNDANQPVPANQSLADTTRRIYQYIKHHDITVGQGGEGTLGGDPLIVLIDGVRRLLSVGTCRMPKFRMASDVAAISFYREDTLTAYSYWLTRAELAALPIANDAPIVVEPPPMATVPNKAADLEAFWHSFNGHAPITDDAQKHVFTANFASHLASSDPRFGRKSRTGNAPVSKDTLAYWLGDPIPTTPTDGKIDAVDIITSSGQVGWDTRAERGDPAYRNIDGRWFPAGPVIVRPPPPPPPNVHQYDGGEHDTDVCDICHLSRFDPVHVTAESKVKHQYNGGEQDTGLCDICQKAASDPIHDLSPHPGPGGNGTGGDTGGLDVEVLALLGQILDSCHAQEERQGETIAAIQELREAVVKSTKDLTAQLVAALPGVLGGLLPFLKKAPAPAKRKRR